jgi:hypothetical protein
LRFQKGTETVKTVGVPVSGERTLLKQGVNEKAEGVNERVEVFEF